MIVILIVVQANQSIFITLIHNTFHPELEIDKVITEYSFGHTEYTVTSLNYLTVDQLNFKNNKTLLKLRDFALNVAWKKSKLVIAEICSPQN